ncbi:MAG: Rid family detoxifying hydrolase [Bifidobacteriaceae bacterium]|nr:Rid family detoxifying hydrolase [Bifidobacteriaceae bacterium]
MMAELEAIETQNAPAALGAYSQAVRANGFVFVSGQLGIDPATGKLAGDTAAEQAAQSVKNIANILAEAGLGTDRVVRATIYMKNVEDFKAIDAEYAKVFGTGVKPARVAFGGNNLPTGALVEIDAIAAE